MLGLGGLIFSFLGLLFGYYFIGIDGLVIVRGTEQSAVEAQNPSMLFSTLLLSLP
jgi:hypothetical protein